MKGDHVHRPATRTVELGDFDFYACDPPVLRGMTPEVWREMPPGEKMRRVFIAWNQVRDIHREWYLERNTGATDFEILCDWYRHTGAAEVLATARKDEAERDADQPIIVTS